VYMRHNWVGRDGTTYRRLKLEAHLCRYRQRQRKEGVLTEMNEVIRSKNGLGDHFNEENRKRMGWLSLVLFY
jgi:hypothetical protein